MKNIRIGDILVNDGYITEVQLQEALSYQKVDKSKRLGAILVEYGYVTEIQLLTALAQRLDLKVIDLTRVEINLEAASKIPKSIAQKYVLIPIRMSNGDLIVATNDPLDFYAIEDLRLITNMPVSVVLAERESIQKAIDFYYSEIEARKAASSANETVDDEEEVSLVEDLDAVAGDDAPIVNLINSMLIKGFNTGASDIHIEPFEEKTNVRLRIDGLIVDYLTLATALHQSVIARIKIL
ncbi:MAG: type II secretion system protein GspE, partial [Eubacterium sp.]